MCKRRKLKQTDNAKTGIVAKHYMLLFSMCQYCTAQAVIIYILYNM